MVRIRVRIRISVWLVSCYAHVFVRLSTDFATIPVVCGSTNIFVGARLRLSCGRSRKVYDLIAVDTVPPWSLRYLCGLLRLWRTAA